MAQTIDLKAKQRKQIIILAVGGVLLLGIMAIQVPKLMKSGSTPAAAPAEAGAETPATEATGATTTAAPVSTDTAGAVSSTSGPKVVVAGVTIGGGGVAIGEGQLWSFSRFPTKDPFVPQVTEGGKAALPGSEARVPPPIDQSFTLPGGGDSGTGSSAAGGASGSGTTAPAKTAPTAFATIQVNGKAEQLQRKQAFPASDPVFVLVGVTKSTAKVGVKGGAFTNGQTVSLERGRAVTLVDTATGARYVMKLVYLGAEPEQIESFSTSPGAAKPKK